MSMPEPERHTGLAEFIERHETLRMIMAWIADRFADETGRDAAIDWEDGEDHDEPHGPAAL